MPILVIIMKFMNTPLHAKQNQEVTFPSSRRFFRKTNMEQKGLSYIAPSLCNNMPLPDRRKKTTVLNICKHKLKSNNLGESILIGLSLVLAYISNFTYLFVYLFIYPFIYLFILFICLFFYLSITLVQPLHPSFYFTYLPFSLPSLTIYFILFTMYQFRYFNMFLTCYPLCYYVIIYLVFIYLLHMN